MKKTSVISTLTLIMIFLMSSIAQAQRAPLPVPVIITLTPEIQLCDDGRINTNLCEPVAIYPIVDEDDIHMVIYNVESGDDEGELSLFVDAEILSGVPDDNEYPIELARSTDNFAILYWMPDGNYVVSAGPDFEGKVFLFTFSEFPSQVPTVVTYFSDTNELAIP